ncbi:uncharacterized protein Pyn_34634 [Prunus yedoensis var. nudiflora]|uniref:DUF3444 domain-containing protein n=1 Tax=Prunus yedoensis var. nudiflora TaxID=2094558 RepID=A0A314YY93_PRUYE|nr:uncharacterized protein Pyn_34634 [Prunus yedoensis var. nudiflora]
MPRFYALVKKVYTSRFKLKITWLEPNPNDQGKIAWYNKELPVACDALQKRQGQKLFSGTS